MVKAITFCAALIITIAIVASSQSVAIVKQDNLKKVSEGVKLAYGSDDLAKRYTGVPNILPIAYSKSRLLIPVGDVLYMLDSMNRVVWEFSVEPNFIYDVAVDSKGTIYLAIFDGLLVALNDSGEEVWSKFMNGAANYTQLERYGDGVLAVLSMEAYRATKGSNSEDFLVFWKNNKEEWRKDFPRNAELHVFGEKILAVKGVKDGKEIKEIH